MNAPGQTKPGTSALDDIFGFDLLGGGSTAAPTQRYVALLQLHGNMHKLVGFWLQCGRI
jgi:hypothetical protein